MRVARGETPPYLAYNRSHINNIILIVIEIWYDVNSQFLVKRWVLFFCIALFYAQA